MTKLIFPQDITPTESGVQPILVDPFGRQITYLRLSITDRCDLRCVYCMAEHMQFLNKKDLLSFEEMERLVGVFVSLGLRKLRITGGEPLVRRGALDFIKRLARFLGNNQLQELTLTTNGTQLATTAQALAECGVKRINVSLDTLNADKFRAITRTGNLAQVLSGLEAAQRAGLSIKLNTVALKGVNENEIIALTKFAHERNIDISFIEVMPLGEIEEDRLNQYMPLTTVRDILQSVFTLENSNHKSGGPARYKRVKETGRLIGFITPHTHNFCESCNRVRISCTGTLYPCLGQEDATDLRAPLREALDDESLVDVIKQAILHKPKGHDFDFTRARNIKPATISRHMSVTGG